MIVKASKKIQTALQKNMEMGYIGTRSKTYIFLLNVIIASTVYEIVLEKLDIRMSNN